jgi:hypothetical protein
MEEAHDMKVVRLNISPFKCVPVVAHASHFKNHVVTRALLTQSDLPCSRNW